MKETLEVWSHWRDCLPKYFEKRNHVTLEFLTEVLDIAPDGYSGTDRVYFYERENRAFYTRISHWDGGNMFANRSGEETALSERDLVRVITGRRNEIVKEMSPEEREAFGKVADDILEILLSHTTEK